MVCLATLTVTQKPEKVMAPIFKGYICQTAMVLKFMLLNILLKLFCILTISRSCDLLLMLLPYFDFAHCSNNRMRNR